MRTKFILLCVAFLSVLAVQLYADEKSQSPLYSENTPTDAHIVGHILDKNTKEHLPYINVYLQGTMIGTSTDETGHYFFKNLPIGEHTIVVSAIGYKTETRTVSLTAGQTLEIDIQIEEDFISLDGVVVSANRTETTRRLAPTLVNVMSGAAFEATTSTCVADGLNFQPGVRVENNCQNCGFQQIRINGLDGPYTQILIDSRPIFNALSGVYGIEQIPVNMVDRVEVMRGGGSALFGSSAIAGTVNIITKEPATNSASLSHSTTSIGGTSALDNITMLNASLVTDDHKMGIAVFGQNRQRDGYDANGDGYTELPTINSQNIGTRMFLKTGTYSRITGEYHHLQEYRRGGDSLSIPPHEANIAEEVTHSINTGSVKFDYFAPNEKHRLSIFGSIQHIDRESYYGAGQNPNAYGGTTDLTWVAGAQYNYKFDKCIFMPAEFIAGVEFNQDILQDVMHGYNRVLNQNTNIASVFVQNEWKNAQWSFLIGGRLDKHNLIDHLIFSPRVTMRYNPIKDINLRASYSFGFRAPQAFNEDLHIDNVGGTVSMIRLADNLKEEKSQSVNVSADFYFGENEWRGNLLVEGFYTYLYNVFALREVGVENGVIIKERYNESGAEVYGGTIEGKVAYKNMWQFQAGFTLQEALYKEARSWSDDPDVASTRKMFRSPNTYGYLTTTYNPIQPLGISVTGTYTGKMLVEHYAGYIEHDRTETTPAFFDMNVKLNYDFKLYKNIILSVYAGVKNVFNSYQKDFDIGADRDSGYIYGPGLPRSYYGGIKLSY
jgi:outer membrane receptor for ferrienterochelin and colicins